MNELTLDQAERLSVLIFDGDAAGIAALLESTDASPVYTLAFVGGCCGRFAALLVNPKGEAGMFVIEQPTAAFGHAKAPIWMQLVNAYANDDEATIAALSVIILDSKAVFKETLPPLLAMMRDLMHLLQETGR